MNDTNDNWISEYTFGPFNTVCKESLKNITSVINIWYYIVYGCTVIEPRGYIDAKDCSIIYWLVCNLMRLHWCLREGLAVSNNLLL